MHKTFEDFITIDGLFQAWYEFRKEKSKRADVLRFERNLEEYIFELYKSLKNKSYSHGGYHSFYVNDPKQRHIHKAEVKDRVVHHLLYIYLYEIYDKTFIFDSYSCRIDKGTHKAVERLEKITRKVSKNYKKNCYALKMDIKKFFASVDHKILLSILDSKITDPDVLWLLKQVIFSFNSTEGRGIPLGNLTSQVFANIYLNKLDQFVKHELKVKYYFRYADDFIILSRSRKELLDYIDPINRFLEEELKLKLHPNKIIFRKFDWGVDFLGYVVLSHYRLPRTKTRKRIFKKIKENISKPNFEQSLQSYLGYLSHANAHKIEERLKNDVWLLR